MASWKRPSENQDESSSGHIEHLVVGDEPCAFVQVRDVLYRCASAGELWPKLIDIAKSLQVPIDRIISLETRIPTKMTTYPGALLEILEAWRGKFSAEAKLQNLINVLERNGLADCADSLRIHFNEFDDAYVISTLKKLKSTDKSSTWKNLPEHLKLWMNSKPVKFQGNENTLQELTALIATPVDDKILDALGARKTPRIVKDNVPARLDYYVHRTVTSRNILKLDVLTEDGKDVFVIEGVERSELSSLVPKNESTDVSGNQLERERLTVRFLLLQHKSDFEQICEIATTPVHWVKYKNGKLELVRSSGSAVNLQKHIHHSQDSFNENELASTSRHERVVVIADSPGMGKTCLLANIAHKIMTEQPTMLVRFIVLKEFVDALAKKTINVESVVKQIAEQSSEYEFGKKLVENALKTQECVLLFDGLDEVLSNQMPTAKKILQAAAELRSAKVFVATRPHLRDEIEVTLHVLAYTMQPFNESNQTNFLAEFWKSKGATDNESLIKFTEKCVMQLSSKMRDNERSIAGIPLQCRMLAESYEAQAIRCSKVGYHSYEGPDSAVMVDSIFGIYERHMELRFEKIRTQQGSRIARLFSFLTKRNAYEIIKNVHMYFALELLFPDHADKFKALNGSSIELHELCGLGILEATHSEDIRFVHRTFAEYLVAWFAHENVINSSANGDSLLSTILKLKPQEVELYNAIGENLKLESFEFNFLVICYFVNGFAKKYALNAPINYNEVLMPFYMASARHNYESFPHIVPHSVAEINPVKTSEVHMRNLFYIAARYSDLELMKMFCKHIDITKINFMKIKESTEYDTFIFTPLHVAVQRVHYPLVEYLVNKFEHIASELRYLILLCVRFSQDGNSIVDDKIQIVKLLSKVNRNWVYEEDLMKRISLMQYGVHVRLFECLLQEHGNLNTIDKNGNTLLHQITEKNRFMTGESYHQIVNALSRHEFKLFNKPNKKHITPLHLAVEHIKELLSITVEVFVSKGADLNTVDEQGDSVLFYAIRYQQSVELMSMLINLGAEANHRNYTGENALHISVLERNLNALKYFIETRNINVNDQDENRNTPLHLAAVEWEEDSWRNMKSSWNTDYESMMMLLMKSGGNVNAENNLHYTPFMNAFECGKGLSLTIIKEMEKHGLNITKSVASKALTASFLRHEFISDTLVPLNTLEYLMKKGGEVDFEFTDNLWKWEWVQKSMPDIIKHTDITSEFLAKSIQHGILTEHDCMELETLRHSVKSNRFYEIVQNKSGSFERVYLIMRGYEDLRFAVSNLNTCLYYAREKLLKQIFVRRNSRVKELIDSNVNVIALVTNDLALSVKRIQDTIDEDVKVVKEHELERRTTGGQNNLIVLKCHTLTTELVNKLVCLNRTCLCVCKQTHDGVEGCEIVTEAHDWVDVSSQFINKLWARVDGNLYNFTQLFATPNVLQQMWLRVKEVYNGNRDNILKLVNYKIVHEQRTYLSIELFGHFLPDKLVFVNINEQDLKTYAKYGHRIGDPSKDIQSLDYVILPESGIHLFDNICRQANSNVHLIEHDKGRFKIVRTWGSQENVAKFFQSTNCTFPFCDCPTSDELVITFRLENWKYKVIKCKLDEVLPNGRRVFAMQEQIDLFELRGLIQHLDVPKPFTSYFNHKMAILKEESEPKRYGKHIPEIICKLVEHVGNGEQHENLYQLAVNTLFRHFAKIVESTSVVVEKYTQLELLEYRKEHLVFKHEVLATYFIAEMIIDQVDSGNECFHEIFRNCFDIAHMNLISISRCDWNDSEYRTKSIRSYKFRETRLFKYLDFLATQDNNKDAIKSVLTKVVSPQSHAKCIHSIVNDNLVNLFEVFIKLGFNDLNTFESEDLVVLAVAHADVSLVEFITHQHRKHTNNQLNNIKLPLLYYYDWDHLDKYKFECFISVLDVAALKSHYSLFEYLNREINQPQKENLVYFCLANTHAYDQVDDRKRIITFLFENHPSLFQNQSNHYHYLLAPNSHVDLINEVINLGVNVNTNSCRNILHDCAEYLTPEEYHRVVNTLVERKQTELFHSRDENQNTPLHVAVIHLELLDSTIQLFSSAKVDFNAVNKYNTTVLHVAVIFERSARILDSLIKAGADEKARGQVNRTVLHLAAESGNLTALKYFILRGHDVNVTDEDGNTPLHFAVYLSEANTHELVVFLVEHGADLSAPKNFGITLLDIVNRKSKIEARTMEYLEIAKMESLLTKWESEIIQHNIDKLSAFTNFESELLQKLILNGIFTQRDVEDLESIERVSLRGNKLYAMLLVKKPDFKILLSAFSDSNNVGVVSILVKELTNYMYNALMYLEVKVVNYAMHTKGYADFLNLFVQAFQETDRQAYADKLSIVQLLCTLNPQVLPPKRSEIYTSLQIAFLSEHDKKLEFIQTIITHVNQPEILDFVYLCLADTRYKYSDVNERKLIITNILQNHPALFQNPQNCYLLLAPNIHVDLIIHLINLDVDVNVTNEKKENILHLCVNYLTAEEYHCVVNVLVEKLETELFHSRDEDQKTPLHVAVRYLELLDSTIKLFSSAKVDFNAVDKYNNTALHYAVIFKRSERTLGSLIKASADEKVRGQYNRTVLHIAASSGNLAALKHFLLRGHNVNGTDEEGFTPLHLAVKLFETNAHEVVVLLVEHGADVNAINKDGETPLDIANDSYFGVASFTKRFLRKHVAKSYESIRETLLEGAHSKWQSEVINSNPEKLTVLTKCDFACIQKLKSTGTSVNVDELIGNDSPDAKDFYSMLLAKKYDLKMILKLLHDTNNTEAVILLTKEVISTLYDALMNRKYSFVHFVMQIKGVYEDLQPLLNAMELIDRHQYTDKLYIIQLIGLLDPQFLKYRRPEILSPMQLALHSRHQKQFELIQLLISHNVDLNERDRKGFTPLNYAVQQKPVPPRVIEIVKLLIENGADPDAVDQLGYTFLHRAPRYLTPELYDELILFFDSSGRKDSLKLLTHHNHSHLHLAVYNFEALMDTLDIFKSNGVDFNGQDMDGVSVVFLGIEGGRDADFLRTLLTYGADWRIPDNSNSNALHTASFFGNVSALKLFIELGCDVNAKNIDGHTPLHNAFLGQKDGEEMTEHEIEIVKLLIENGADPDAVDQQGRTFLHNAPYFLTPELYDQLIMFLDSSGRKDSLKVRDFHNWSHLHHAVANFDPLPSTLNKFKSNGIDFNGQDNDGDSVVFDAIEGGRNAEFLRTLFKYGADWRILNKTQENALHAAALYGNVSALKLFIQLGCDVNATNIEGRTPLHNVFLGETNSADMKEHEIVVILLKERVDVTVKDTQGKTAIELAKERLVSGKVKQETVKILEKYSLKSYF